MKNIKNKFFILVASLITGFLISNNININFLREMIVHHQGGVRLAQNVLRFCICQELIPILRNMIQTMCDRICEMEKLLDALKDCENC